MEWRLIVDAPAGGAWNMAVDEALAEAVDAGASPPVLRLYRWAPPCLSLGFAQPYDAADAAFCAAHAIDVVRRPTGGRAVLHHLELTYSVCAPLGRAPFSRDLQAAYQTICRALVAGLRRLGVAAELSGAPENGMIKPTQAIPCFIGPAAGEVVVGGPQARRLGDAAGRRRDPAARLDPRGVGRRAPGRLPRPRRRPRAAPRGRHARRPARRAPPRPSLSPRRSRRDSPSRS